jgi:hypothetical protein
MIAEIAPAEIAFGDSPKASESKRRGTVTLKDGKKRSCVTISGARLSEKPGGQVSVSRAPGELVFFGPDGPNEVIIPVDTIREISFPSEGKKGDSLPYTYDLPIRTWDGNKHSVRVRDPLIIYIHWEEYLIEQILSVRGMTITFDEDRPVRDAADLPKTGPGDPELTYAKVAENPPAFRGQRVTWTAIPMTGAVPNEEGAESELLFAVNPEAGDARRFKVYLVKFPKGGVKFLDIFTKGKGAVTGTIVGDVSVSYDATGPGGVGKEKKSGKVPLLRHATFQADGDSAR